MFDENLRSKFPFSAFTLKMVALITMVIDHFGAFAYGSGVINDVDHLILRQIGRISFVLFAFIAANSIQHTSNKEKYLLRLFGFGFIIEIILLMIPLVIPNFSLPFPVINIFITLFLGTLTCYFFDKKWERPSWWKRIIFVIPLLISIGGLFIFKEIFGVNKDFDYSFYGVGLIFIFYLLKDNLIWKSVSLVVWNVFILKVMPMLPFEYGQFPADMRDVQILSILSIPFILLYNGHRGYSSRFMKWFFYLFYPLHLAILGIIFFML